jgi:hypothetical protein
MKRKLIIGQNMNLDIELVIKDDVHQWWQVTGVHRANAVKQGDLVRHTLRGWEVFRTLDATSPVSVFPTRCQLQPIDEEE